MYSKYISSSKFNFVLQKVSSENSMLFYNPLKKTYLVGFETLLDQHDSWEAYRTTKKNFYSLPFFTEQAVHKDSKWEGMCYGKKTFPHLYEFCFPVEAIFLENQPSAEHADFVYQESDYATWQVLFEQVMREIKQGTVHKVVASREVEITKCFPLTIHQVIKQLLLKNPDSFVFFYKNGEKVFLGASPEILVQKEGNVITSYALAGTAAKAADADGHKLLADPKNNYEHQVVIDAIAKILNKNARAVSIGKTELLELKNLYHLKTKLSCIDEQLSLVDWAKKLHPTPAMGGAPKNAAIRIIHQYEKHDRGLFAAPIGIVDQTGDGVFIVGIRSALVTKDKLYAYAGCGLVEQSDCRQEYEEITNKLHTITEALV